MVSFEWLYHAVRGENHRFNGLMVGSHLCRKLNLSNVKHCMVQHPPQYPSNDPKLRLKCTKKLSHTLPQMYNLCLHGGDIASTPIYSYVPFVSFISIPILIPIPLAHSTRLSIIHNAVSTNLHSPSTYVNNSFMYVLHVRKTLKFYL